jgi:hypothetical protein
VSLLRLAAASLLLTALAACTSSAPQPQPSSTPPPATSAPPTSSTPTRPPVTTPSTRPRPVREVDGTCPYISTQELANRVGSRIGRTTVLTSTPRGCRFYLPFADFHAVAQITPRAYDSATAAHNGMIHTAEKGAEPIGVPHLAPGTEGILYRTQFYKPDGGRDWACIFRRGRIVVTVKTDQNDTSYNARQIAIAISPKF